MFFGLALCMLLYSLEHWASLRDTLFGYYALLLGGNVVFLLSYFGIGPLYLWPELPQLSQQIAPLGVLVSVAAATVFSQGLRYSPILSPSIRPFCNKAHSCSTAGL